MTSEKSVLIATIGHRDIHLRGVALRHDGGLADARRLAGDIRDQSRRRPDDTIEIPQLDLLISQRENALGRYDKIYLVGTDQRAQPHWDQHAQARCNGTNQVIDYSITDTCDLAAVAAEVLRDRGCSAQVLSVPCDPTDLGAAHEWFTSNQLALDEYQLVYLNTTSGTPSLGLALALSMLTALGDRLLHVYVPFGSNKVRHHRLSEVTNHGTQS